MGSLQSKTFECVGCHRDYLRQHGVTVTVACNDEDYRRGAESVELCIECATGKLNVTVDYDIVVPLVRRVAEKVEREWRCEECGQLKPGSAEPGPVAKHTPCKKRKKVRS